MRGTSVSLTLAVCEALTRYTTHVEQRGQVRQDGQTVLDRQSWKMILNPKRTNKME